MEISGFKKTTSLYGYIFKSAKYLRSHLFLSVQFRPGISKSVKYLRSHLFLSVQFRRGISKSAKYLRSHLFLSVQFRYVHIYVGTVSAVR
jgi:hypothetical protein